MCISLISWLDTHSGAITAIATVVLVLITVAYVVVTYMLVHEQRVQANAPEVEYEWDNSSGDNADIQLHNVGTGTAVEVMILRGPRDGVEAEMALLDDRRSLLAGERLLWPIRPTDPNGGFETGELSLTISYFDTKRRMVFFNALLLRFNSSGELPIADVGSVFEGFTRRQLRRLARRSLNHSKRLGFHWRTRDMSLSALQADEKVRDALRVKLGKRLETLEELSQQLDSYEGTF